jgi:hypothetical protein
MGGRAIVFLTNRKDYELFNSERFFNCMGEWVWVPANGPRLQHSRAGMRGSSPATRMAGKLRYERNLQEKGVNEGEQK